MHLKALEIQGFKSFPERTVITFHEGVTAIIGPNGSGKSNVTDAIRWVLGEQSVKTLRGSRMEDVIFTGTQSRRAMSFAEVTMVIDNSDQKLPLEYSEVQITRRLYRSGESEYLLNKTTCRLRDIARLFMDTGLGRDGYSIVGQGRVDEILSHRSEDRRRIFEEASGIVKYKSQKDETERKLQSTEQNLLRINDLISELESRLEPLEEQSAKTRRFMALSETLKHAEIALILDAIDQQQEKLADAEAEKELVHADLAAANRDLAVLKDDNRKTSEKLQTLEEQITSKQRRLAELNAAVSENNSRMALHDERVRYLQEQLKTAESEASELAGSLSQMSDELNTRREKTATLRRQQALYQGRLSETEAEMQAILSTLDSAEKAIETDKQQLDQLADVLFDKKNDLNQTENQVALVQSRRRTIRQELMEMTSDLDRLRLLQEETQGGLQKIFETEKNIAEGKIKTAQALEQQRSAVNKLSASLEAQRQSQRNQAFRLKTLSDLERSHEGYNEAVRHLLDRADRDASFARGILGTVGSLLAVDQRYELAVETALDPAIQNIVTDREETAGRLISELKQSRTGRATFLPLQSIRPRRLEDRLISQMNHLPGYIGLASDLVQMDEKVRPAAEYLLGRVVIAGTLDQAVAMARKTGYACRIVTLEGDVLNPGGSMSGGFYRKGGSGLLGRGREIETLTGSLTNAARVIKAGEQELADGELALHELARQLDEFEKQQLTQSHLRIREEARLTAQVAEQDKVAARQQLLQDEDDQLGQQAGKIRADVTAISKNIAELEERSERIRARVQEQEGISRAEREKRDDLREEMTEWRVSLQSVEESLQSAEEMISRIELDRSGQESRLLRRRQEQVAASAEMEQIRSAKVSLAAKIDEVNRAGSALAAEMHADLEEKNRLEQSQSAFFDKLEAATGRIAALQGEFSRNEARCLRIESLIDDAKNKLWEIYELTVERAADWRQADLNRQETSRQVNSLKNAIRDLGTVNLAAVEEYETVRDRYVFLARQRDDIEQARHQLTGVIKELTEAMQMQFVEHFHRINENFSQVFAELFGGGTAELNLENEQDVLACGIEIKAQPPGKKLQNLLLLSGGERCLTAIALLFAILKLRPTPFCVLDEVEAALDDANVLRFTEYIGRYAHDSQFILVTHRKGTMEAADRLYGVTMQERGISRILSMKLTD